MSEYQPPSVPINQIVAISPNVFEHQAVEPIVFRWELDSSIAALGSIYVEISQIGTFSVWEFSLYPIVDILFNASNLADIVLQTSSFGNFNAGVAPIYEEKRWAMNVGLNPLTYRPRGRYGRFQLVNRGNSIMNYSLQLAVRSL